MQDKNKPASAKQKPEHTIRCGEITVSIYQRQANSGHRYRDYILSRVWKNVATGRESQSSSFFDTNEAALIESIKKATAWLREKRNDPDGVESEDQSMEGRMD